MAYPTLLGTPEGTKWTKSTEERSPIHEMRCS